jgi:pimeloyl-ACP methyl ester carboxylesterase
MCSDVRMPRSRIDGGAKCMVETMRQLATLVPHGRFAELPGMAHNLWSTDPDVWVDLVTRLCRAHLITVSE